MTLSELRDATACKAARATIKVSDPAWMPTFVSGHVDGCDPCAQLLGTESELAAAFALLRSESSEAPPGLVTAVVDSLGARLPGDRLVGDRDRFSSLVRRQRVAAISTAVVAACATGFVLTHRKRAEMAH